MKKFLFHSCLPVVVLTATLYGCGMFGGSTKPSPSTDIVAGLTDPASSSARPLAENRLLAVADMDAPATAPITAVVDIPATGKMRISGIVDYEIIDDTVPPPPPPPPPECVPTPGQERKELSCFDGLDNDCDKLVDTNDPDCVVVPPPPTCVPTPGQEQKETSCTDRRDNDCDGLIDRADPDCVIAPPPPTPPTGDVVCGDDGVDNSCPPQLLNALVEAAAAGDVIRIAAGVHDWKNNSATGVVIDKNITITGGGQCDNCGEIPDQIATPDIQGRWPAVIDIGRPQHQYGENDFLVRVPNGAAGTEARITGLAFQGYTKFNYNWFGDTPGAFIHVSSGNYSPYRIDNNYFHDFNKAAGGGYDCGVMQTHAYYAYGVVYSNYIETDSNSGHVLSIYRLAQTDNYGGESMMEEPKYGSDEFVFFEDNTVFAHCEGSSIPFGAPGLDIFNGGRVVARHNVFRNGNITVHDLSGGKPSRSGHAQEIYGNEFVWYNCAAWAYANAITWRGGTMIVWGNNVDNYQYPVNVYNTRAGGSSGGWGRCQAGNTWDGSGPPGGHPCADGPGYVQSPGPTPTTLQPQVLTPGRFWSNLGTPVGGCTTPENGGWICNKSQFYVNDGEQYIFSVDDAAAYPGYVPYPYPHPMRS